MSFKIFIIAGEKSGDFLASKIISSIKKEIPDIEIFGIGGDLMEKHGMKSIFPMSDLSIMGIFEVLPKIPLILKRIRETIASIKKIKPDILFTIDSPDFCFRVAKKIKKSKENIKIVHLVAPSVWANREYRAKKVSKIYDKLLCLLPFEPPYFTKYGLDTQFIGHPIFDNTQKSDETDKENFLSNYSLANAKNVCLTPGSRLGEVNKHIPLMIDVIGKMRLKFPVNCFIITTKKTFNLVKETTSKADFECIIIANDDEKALAIKNSDIGIVKSGTNVFEFNIAKIPVVVTYKMNVLTIIIGKMISSIKFANLVNIIGNKEIIPEFTLFNAKSHLIAEKAIEILNNKDIRDKQVAETQEIIKTLGYKSDRSSSEIAAREIIKSL